MDVRSPNPIDIHVGARVRLRRKLLGISQEQLATALKLTFQQVQKYERGANRISASKLYETASALQVPVAYFFEGLSDPSEGGSESQDHAAVGAINAFLNTAEGLELARSFLDIGPGRLRRQVLELVRALAVAPD